MLRVECTKCDRRGLYLVRKLIAKHGRKGNMSAWLSDLKGDCPKRDGRLCRRCCDTTQSRNRTLRSPFMYWGGHRS